MDVRAQLHRVPSPSVLFVICSPALALPSPSGGGMGQGGEERSHLGLSFPFSNKILRGLHTWGQVYLIL